MTLCLSLSNIIAPRYFSHFALTLIQFCEKTALFLVQFSDTSESFVVISILETTTSIRRLATAEFAKRDLYLFEPTFADFRVKVAKSQS